MSQYQLFNSTVEIPDSDIRMVRITEKGTALVKEALQDYKTWYNNHCGSPQNFIDNCVEYAAIAIRYNILQPLYKCLPSYGIYDLGETTYMRYCLHSTSTGEMTDILKEELHNIFAAGQVQKDYRSVRKATRTRAIGGGFGLSGAIKGMVKAGAINAATGLAHSVANAVGNAKTEEDVRQAVINLFRSSELREGYVSAVTEDAFAALDAHIRIVNKSKPGYFTSGFSSERAVALLENAKRYPAKAPELLCSALVQDPFNADILKHIFVNYNSERITALKMARDFGIDLSSAISAAIRAEYTAKAKSSEAEALKAKERILAIMNAAHISQNDTFDELEQDCLKRLSADYRPDDADASKDIVAAFTAYSALDKNKKSVILEKRMWELASRYDVQFSSQVINEILTTIYPPQTSFSEADAPVIRGKLLQVMGSFGMEESEALNRLENDGLGNLCSAVSESDEARCNEILQEIEDYSASEKNKETYRKIVRTRIEEIWSAEDGEIFDNLYQVTDILNDESIQNALAYIREKGRTRSSEKYIDALNCCRPWKLKLAYQYHYTICAKLIGIVGLLFVAASFVLCRVLPMPKVLTVLIQCIGVLAIIYFLFLNHLWNTLTMHGAIIHKQLSTIGKKSGNVE